MAAEVKKEIELEIAHVLFLDIVGYSKLSVNEQHAQVEELNEIVRLCEQFRKAEAASRLLKIPTGDGMALVFYKSPEEPAQCAIEISRALKDNARLQVRMGMHSGPVSGVVDVTERTNVAGAGINIALRVMHCGDAGHILLSRHVAEDLAEYERWRPVLHDIGTFEVKHGVPLSITNLYSDEVGNPRVPSKLQAIRKRRIYVRWAAVAAALIVLGAKASRVILTKSPFEQRNCARHKPTPNERNWSWRFSRTSSTPVTPCCLCGLPGSEPVGNACWQYQHVWRHTWSARLIKRKSTMPFTERSRRRWKTSPV
jgi:hypothetical protein